MEEQVYAYKEHVSIPTGLHSTNYKAEAMALRRGRQQSLKK